MNSPLLPLPSHLVTDLSYQVVAEVDLEVVVALVPLVVVAALLEAVVVAAVVVVLAALAERR